MPFLKTPYNFDSDIDSFSSGLDCSDSPSLAQQHFRDECDINIMVERFARTGVPPAPQVPAAVEFNEVFDFQSAMNVVVEAQRGFSTLPAKVRARFSNSPGEFLAFVQDESNRDEAVALGLVPKPVPAVVEPVAPVVPTV